MGMRLNPPIVENKTIAQCNPNNLSIPFLMNRSVGWADFDSVNLVIKTVQSNTELLTLNCLQESLTLKDGKYWGAFSNGNKPHNLQIGQYYKAQLAYVKNNEIGFYSTVTTFKFTAEPSVLIQKLDTRLTNIYSYTYTGVYKNERDASEKVYSYEFNLYDDTNQLVASSGELLHNATQDQETTSSTDSWTTRYGLEENKTYLLNYKVKTINGLEWSSPSYKIIDNQTIPSTLFKYCDFVAENNSDSACVELFLKPHNLKEYKYINGQFVLLRSSNEDNFNSWHELTRFVLASFDTSKTKFICKDYCVSQGVKYKYALQAYNNQGLYSTREETKEIFVDFEDMFLSDGERQLRIKFNPKVTSFKPTLLETKMDTIGNKYPFFFRNGNVNYKEFPISGLISMLMDEYEEFMQGIQFANLQRKSTPAKNVTVNDLSTALTGDNFRREREFKMEVLNWLTNGKPKLFRSPGEGNFIVRLMNTSLSPNDTLSRMLHTFNSTAYEVADYTFENLRKYGMMMDEYLETRNLNFFSVDLHEADKGSLFNLNARTATLTAAPGTKFRMKLEKDSEGYTVLQVGATGVYVFPNEVLAENSLMEIRPPEDEPQSKNHWLPQATLVYSNYARFEIDDFSDIKSISTTDKIDQWIGHNTSAVNEHLDSEKILKNIGLVYYLNVSKRPINKSVTAIRNGGEYDFYEDDVVYHPGKNELIYYNGVYYDGEKKQMINGPLNFDFQLRLKDDIINLKGLDEEDFVLNIDDKETLIGTGGRIILTNVTNVDSLFLGNGLFIDIAYQEIEKTYCVEETPGHVVYKAKQKWENTKSPNDYEIYYNLLVDSLQNKGGGLIVDAI